MSKFNADTIITMKDIVREGDPVLREVTKEVTVPLTEEDRGTLIAMMQYLKNSQDPAVAKKYGLRPGIGLSANQIGLNKRMFTAYFTNEKGEPQEHYLINPKIISHSVGVIFLPEGEGCLSVDRDVKGYVPRYERIKVKAHNLDGEEVTLRFKGVPSIIMQHEIDHLNGIMFYDRIDKNDPFKIPDNSVMENF
ncbi:peptide deformylase [Cytobacillus firmus]|uniref:peptide deformylase n=1 Tax=Cytobacillus firmus TaxID=1399 RepID=UPI00064ECA85|nr:peptide deformylase [Cytobacillus firmus]KML45279.1 peptide deformylase [Cytobacillus firmus]MCS0655961.1 peptide deformylase [Cytobacillus firmus]